MKRNLLLVLAGCLVVHTALATDSTAAVKEFMKKVQQAYTSASYLSYHVTFRYANKDQPGQYIDTMSGEVALHKNRTRFMIGDVETITNDNYTIRVNNDEKLIYLTTPQAAPMSDPVAMLDSALIHNNGIRAEVTHNKGTATLSLGFPPGQTYKKIIMIINEKTGFFQKVVYDLNTEGLVQSDQMMGQGSGLYQSEGRIEIVFSEYRQGRFTDELFNEARYINRLAQGKYEPSENYKDYEVFLASSKL